jgi:hypothetical protein
MAEERCPFCAEVIDRTDQVCPHCQKRLAGRALLAETSGAPRSAIPPTAAVGMVALRSRPSGIAKLFWGVSTLASLVGGVGGLLMFGAASSAPQEAAAAAVACLVVIAPYTLARAVDELTRE